ncbi:PLDc N-terminal domain-containing protein [Herbiconiux flava]|uniref:Asparagine N-glycosylation enzyme membrane subunit Stt3 n=1 Tax=Herbiconiux flava TaxID=881268 RepID=A0A852SI12_9MICO|nr:PLDc N-terminal domain-containing protein [Herbiconiux flava]NYD68860.1 asparagine N-glycosylation enzyme membrane subunit Stt3 [Herbiconiux flava]GLK15601.1 hypothetical protein GCM10017602_00830 [Herbiconiux flava]
MSIGSAVLDDSVEPVVPLGFEIGGALVAVVWLTLLVGALIGVVRSQTLSGAQRVLWMAAVLLLPLVGALAWWVLCLVGRSAARGRG